LDVEQEDLHPVRGDEAPTLESALLVT